MGWWPKPYLLCWGLLFPGLGVSSHKKKNATSVSGCFTVKKPRFLRPTMFRTCQVHFHPPKICPRNEKVWLQNSNLFRSTWHTAQNQRQKLYVYIYICICPPNKEPMLRARTVVFTVFHAHFGLWILGASFWGAAYINKIYKINDM